jgi:hypothetical protein
MEKQMPPDIKLLTALAIGLGSLLGYAQTSAAAQNQVTAIDVALEPDATMIQHAQAANAKLLKVFPKGFALDATHHPHISIVQRFVLTADLADVYAAVGKVFATSNAAGWKLKAFKYYYIPSGELGLGGIVVQPTPDLLKLQQQVIDAVTPFTAKTGTTEAFYTTPDEPTVSPQLIQYVSTFVPNASGAHFNPHVTIGLAPRTYLDPLLAQPFESFIFSPVGASVYQLGDFGTARKKLMTWELKT